jgi:SpoVK/Ycf46/Vps4 family AAA+-type ATPase
MGVEVFDKRDNVDMTWDFLAGYEAVKKDIEETIINALKYPEIYDAVTSKTRIVKESNRPKAVLLAGNPGTGK